MLRKDKIRFVAQRDQMDCGPACISMIASQFGKDYPLEYLKSKSHITKEGVSLLGIKEASECIGFNAVSLKLGIEDLLTGLKNAPCILHWNQNHFVVLYKAKNRGISKKQTIFYILDPAFGKITLTEKELLKEWTSDSKLGICLFLQPSKEFFDIEPPEKNKINITYILKYLKSQNANLITVFLLLLMGSGITLIFPFLTQSLIDQGVNEGNVNFITTILLAQLGLYIGSITIEFYRNWLTLKIGTYISIKVISDFLKRMIGLPIKFFDTKLIGDFQQRIQDNKRIEEFLTSHSLITFFSIIMFSVFFGVLWYYDFTILIIYLLLTVVSVLWSLYWLKKRKRLDYYSFEQRSRNQESILEVLKGISEIKLNQLEKIKIKEWENIQHKLFQLNKKILKIDQIQLSGFQFINNTKNVVITYLASIYVVQEEMTLGMLLSVSYIIGQMNSPVNQLIDFFRSFQDATLSLERLDEVQFHKSEEEPNLKHLHQNKLDGIQFENMSFQYGGPNSNFVLRNINFTIAENKTTAIVGASGSGKTTLMKLLLRFYNPTVGNIYYNKQNVLELSPMDIRRKCGVVMQNGYIFSGTIKQNIITSDENPDKNKLDYAIKVANIQQFIEELPLGLSTKIGAAGNEVSGGQKQRILIARAVYKDPHYIFLDEATSALDAENEKIIYNNLQSYLKKKTVVVIAHRLSTVKNADTIIVLNKGKIVEVGNHNQLVINKGEYYNLVRNQLELGD